METKELQKQVIEFIALWDKKRSSAPNEQETFNHIVEELGELASQYVNKTSRKDKYDESEIENAIGDLLMQIIKLADQRGLDIETVITKIIKNEMPLIFENKV